MRKTTLLLLLGTILFVQCTNSEENKTTDMENKDSTDGACCAKDSLKANAGIEMKSEITCPKCGHKELETMPTDVCVIKYTCKSCSAEMQPKSGDCCVFCTHGDHKCPSMQE